MTNEPATDSREHVQLRIQDDQLTFTVCAGADSLRSLSGSLDAVRATLAAGMLNEARLESAIAHTEDLIMPLLRELPESEQLEVAGSELAGFFDALPASAGSMATIDGVERMFNQLADHAAGSPIAWSHALPAEEVALGLTVLREVMHHGGFCTVAKEGSETSL